MKRGISGYLVASLLLHLIIGIILLVGVDFSKPKRPESKGTDRQCGHDGQRNAGAADAQQVQQQKQAPAQGCHSSRKTRKTLSASNASWHRSRSVCASPRQAQAGRRGDRKAEADKQKKEAEQKQAGREGPESRGSPQAGRAEDQEGRSRTRGVGRGQGAGAQEEKEELGEAGWKRRLRRKRLRPESGKPTRRPRKLRKAKAGREESQGRGREEGEGRS